MPVNWRQEIWPLIGSIGFGAFTLGVFFILAMYFTEPDRYQAGPYLGGLIFLGAVIALCTFFVVVIYGVPVYFLFRFFGVDGLPWFLLAGLLPAIPLMIADYPETYAAGRVAVCGLITASATWLARFGYFARRPLDRGERESS